MRAAFTLFCPADHPTRFVAEAVSPDDLVIDAAYASCTCPDRPTEAEAEREAARIFDDRAGAEWTTLGCSTVGGR